MSSHLGDRDDVLNTTRGVCFEQLATVASGSTYGSKDDSVYQACRDAENARLGMHREIVEAARQRQFGYVHQESKRAANIVSTSDNTCDAHVWHCMNEAVIHTVSVDLDPEVIGVGGGVRVRVGSGLGWGKGPQTRV